METYARELIPRLAERADLRLTCLVNREAAAAGDGPWGEVCPLEIVPVHARNRIEWVRGEQRFVPRIAARLQRGRRPQPRQHRAAARGAGARHDDPRPELPARPGGALRAARPRACGCSSRRPRAARSASWWTPRRPARTCASTWGSRPRRSTSCRWRPRPTRRPPPRPRTSCASAWASGRARSRSARGPSARTRTSPACSRRSLRCRRPTGRCSWSPGYPTPYEAELRERAAAFGIAGDVRFPEYLGAADLEGLYALAALVVVPSLYEGFGLPVLEAMARGVPVVTSDRSSLPEVAGDAALLVDPDDAARDRARRSARCSATRPSPHGCAPPAGCRRRASRGSAPPSSPRRATRARSPRPRSSRRPRRARPRATGARRSRRTRRRCARAAPARPRARRRSRRRGRPGRRTARRSR